MVFINGRNQGSFSVTKKKKKLIDHVKAVPSAFPSFLSPIDLSLVLVRVLKKNLPKFIPSHNRVPPAQLGNNRTVALADGRPC
jgi:hypothetical protein